ncbi:uncharacterized protein LOC133195836 [Saccostrea echinata]|uniref:uncharacterized protein LOC133195836 n=1 Tax=Saccostrea echinata TaxID=191078 RepID=UPI002A81CBA2|nr:uncharacterized protein LOC133195836 [Saccostrea echinata]
MSEYEFSLTGHSVGSRPASGSPRRPGIGDNLSKSEGPQKTPYRRSIYPESRNVQLEVTAKALKNKEVKIQYWSPEESYTDVSQQGGDTRQVISMDQNSNVQESASLHSTVQSMSASLLYPGWNSLVSGYGGGNRRTVISSSSAADKVVISSPKRIVVSSPDQIDQYQTYKEEHTADEVGILSPKSILVSYPDKVDQNKTPGNHHTKSTTGLTPSVSAMTVSGKRDISKSYLPSTQTDSNNNSSSAPSSIDALRTIKEFFVASQQHVLVLKKNLVDYVSSESSESSDGEQTESVPDVVVSTGHAGVKRKKNSEERGPAKKKSDNSKLAPSTSGFIGPIDMRSVTTRSLDCALDVQRLTESFESKHYGRKTHEGIINYKEEQNVYSPERNSQIMPKSVVSSKSKSPKILGKKFSRTVIGTPTSRTSPRCKDGKKSPRPSVSVKLNDIVQTKTSETMSYSGQKVSIDKLPRPPNGASSLVSFSSMSEQYSSIQKKVIDVPSVSKPSTAKWQPFWASCGSSANSPLMGRQEYEANEEEKSTLKRHFRSASAPENRHTEYYTSMEVSNTQEMSSLSGDSNSITGASLLPHRLRFYQHSRLSYSPKTSALSYNWKENFKRTCNSYGEPYFDSHCHIDFLFSRQRFCGSWSRFKAVNEETFPDNFAGCVAVFCNPFTFKADGLWKDVSYEEDVWLAFGCHPKSATDFSLQSYNGLKTCLQHRKVVALGEIGLDYSGTFKQHMDVQKIVFRRQIQLALEMEKPLVIHCRDAEEDCLQILKEMVPKNYKIHCHCFTGDYTGATRWIEAFPRLFIGLTPMVTYRQCVQTHNVARYIPLNKLLLETDAPYFLPRKIPKEEMALSHPGMAITVAERVAFFQQCTVQQVLQACRNNMREMYGI